MLTGNWLQANKLNHIIVSMGGKNITIQCTLSQVERYEALLEKACEGSKSIKERIEETFDIVEIAMNPKPSEMEYPREKLMEEIDIDQAKIIAQVWIDRKLFSPRIEADPILGLQNRGA